MTLNTIILTLSSQIHTAKAEKAREEKIAADFAVQRERNKAARQRRMARKEEKKQALMGDEEAQEAQS